MDKGIVFFGSSEFSVTVLSTLLSKNIKIDCVVTTPDQPSGRHLSLTPNPLKLFAQTKNLKIIENLKDLKPTNSIGLVAAYGKIIPSSTLNTFNNQIYNIHPSLLPIYRGPSPLQYQILENSPVGVSLIRLDDQMDHGPIISQATDNINSTDTWIALGHRLFKIGTDLFLTSDLTKSVPQDENIASYTKKITRQDGYITYIDLFSGLKAMNQDLITKYRAFFNWPGVWTISPKNKRIKLISINPTLIQEEGKKPTPWR